MPVSTADKMTYFVPQAPHTIPRNYHSVGVLMLDGTVL